MNQLDDLKNKIQKIDAQSDKMDQANDVLRDLENAIMELRRKVHLTIDVYIDPEGEHRVSMEYRRGDVQGMKAVWGLFIRESSLMSLVRRGDRVGAVIDEFGRELETILAPKSGYITTLRRSAVVEPGLPVVGVTGLRPPSLGVPSDAFVLPRKSQP